MTTTPRIRQELKAAPIEEAGIQYFDVSDPRSGASMRLYDFEWLIAQKLDGAASLDEVAKWAGGRFDFAPSARDLAAYVDKLAELGFLDAAHATDGRAAPPPESAVYKSLELTIDDEPEVEISHPPAEAEPVRPRAHSPVDVAPVAPPPAPKPQPRPQPMVEPPPPADLPRETTGVTGKGTTGEPKRPSPLTWLLLLALLGVGGFAVWNYLIDPRLEPVHVKVQLAPAAREVVRYYDGKGVVARSEPLTLSFGESGKVADVVAPGTDAKAGMTLASLEAATAIEKELADVRDREAFYATQLKAAQAKGNTDEAKKFQEKVGEKLKRVTELEERVKKVRLVAPGSASVAEVLVIAGVEVKEGNPAIKLVDKRMIAEFKLTSADAAGMKPGAQVAVAGTGASAAARVLSVTGGAVKVELLDDGGGAVKAGDQVSLVRNRTPNVVVEPAAAVGKSQGGADQVFVLSNGVLHARPVTVVGRTDTEAYVTSGLQAGESIVVSPTETLQEGQKAVSE